MEQIMALRHPIESDELESPEGVTYLTGEAAHAFFEQEVQRLVGISGDEFIRRYDAGEYAEIEDIPENWNILEAAYLIGFGRAR
jgi:hypothetical protein